MTQQIIELTVSLRDSKIIKCINKVNISDKDLNDIKTIIRALHPKKKYVSSRPPYTMIYPSSNDAKYIVNISYIDGFNPGLL